MNCPRCGAKMTNGACSECGFPVTRTLLNKRGRVFVWKTF